MTDIFIISNASRAASYGIGTYTEQFVSCLETTVDVRISHIEMFSDSAEFEMATDKKGQVHYKVPVFSGSIEDETSCKNAFYLLSQHLAFEEGSSPVFLFNYFQHYHLAAWLKVAYPHSRIFLVIHYLNWCFDLKGNDTKFRQHIAADPGDESDNDTSEIGKKVRTDYKRERDFMRLADNVVALSKATQKIITEDYGIDASKITLIANGIPSPSAACPDAPIENTSNDPVLRYLLFVGRLDAIKGVTYLIKAFKRLCSDHDNLRLLIVGDGDFSSCMAAGEGCWDKITFTGKVSKIHLEHIYAKASIGVLPSFHEQCSFSAVEMLAHGIPMVITDTTGLKEMMEETPSCIVHIDKNEFSEDEFVCKLYESIHRLLSDQRLLEEASRTARAIYMKRYTQATMRERYLDLLQKRNSGVFSKDLLDMIDHRMFQLTESRPDIETEFYGMTGIGCYLWHRVKQLDPVCEWAQQVRQHLDDWIGWMDSVLAESSPGVPDELCSLASDMKEHGYPHDGIWKLASCHGRAINDRVMQESSILSNALRIYLCRI